MMNFKLNRIQIHALSEHACASDRFAGFDSEAVDSESEGRGRIDFKMRSQTRIGPGRGTMMLPDLCRSESNRIGGFGLGKAIVVMRGIMARDSDYAAVIIDSGRRLHQTRTAVDSDHDRRGAVPVVGGISHASGCSECLTSESWTCSILVGPGGITLTSRLGVASDSNRRHAGMMLPFPVTVGDTSRRTP